jgi:glycosyltransferase involved in cell wall biosynthesis
MTAIHQFVPTLAPRDAVGTHYLAIQETLRAAGYVSDIYAYEAKDEFRRRARPFTAFDGARNGAPTWLLYHSSIGSPVADFVFDRDEPLLVDYHNITPASFFARWEPAVAGRLTKGRRQTTALAARATVGLADSAFNARELQTFGYQSTAVVPILLDVDALGSTPPDPSVRRSGATTWLFVGRIAPNKAQQDLVKALAAYRRQYDGDARLVLVGPSSSHSYETALYEFVEALGLGDAVTCTGAVSDAQLTAHYKNADAFVVASEHEGFCVPLLEAMHHRVPIIAYTAAAVPETLGDAGLLLDNKEPYTIAEGVHRVLTESALRRQLIDAGSRRLHEFDLEHSKRKLLDAIVPVVGAPR